MAPPHKIDSYLQKLPVKKTKVEIPAFLERKKIEEKLNSSVLEKEFLIREIHHRVKNNLQIISSLLNLQSAGISDPKIKEKYNESIGRIKSMAIIHELLYQSNDLSNIKIKKYLEELVSFISSTYNTDKEVGVKLEVKTGQEFIDLDKAIPCGIIINELLSNSFKYAFENKKRKASIRVSFKEHRNKCTLEVSDNGSGFPESVDFKNSSTLGLQLINSLVEQLDGQLKVDVKKGSSFIITF